MYRVINMNNVGAKLQEIRVKAGVSQQAMAEYLGITRQAYSHYEVGRRKPDYETLLKLAEYFGISVLDILGNEKAPAASGERKITDDDIKFALFGGDGEITDAMYDEVRSFAAFVKQREEQKKKE